MICFLLKTSNTFLKRLHVQEFVIATLLLDIGVLKGRICTTELQNKYAATLWLKCKKLQMILSVDHAILWTVKKNN